MKNMKYEILKMSGLYEGNIYEEVLNEGIVFFKNSKKIQKLSNALNKKAEKMLKKGEVEASKELLKFANEANRIAGKFEVLEKQYSIFANREDKQKLIEQYKNTSSEFSVLINIARTESFKRAAVAAKCLAITAGVLLGGGILLYVLESGSGVLTGAVNNLQQRVNMPIAPQTITRSSNLGTRITQSGRIISNRLETAARGSVIDQTNEHLLKASLAVGATVAGVAGVGILSKLKKAGINNKVIFDTVAALEELKSVEIGSSSKRTIPMEDPMEDELL